MSFAVGSLVRARGREWVVLPESSDDWLLVRPLGGTEDEETGICTAIEKVDSAEFPLPDPSRDLGDFRSCKLLRDAVRLGFRASAGPFRSFARLGFEPRPYQMVPLLVGLKLDPVRLLIADDVGIGKTIEAALIARELIDRGEVQRLAVLCPPHLADQWQDELREKFHIDAELVLPGTARSLEKACAVGQSLFDVYPHVIVSLDFIKTDARRDDFLRACPEMVIVDEAHTCAFGAESKGARHQRHALLAGLAKRPDRHVILATGTPHSGNENAFRSLLSILNADLANLPDDLTGPAHEADRRELARYFVQRRRADIRHYMQSDTPFPERLEKESTWKLSPEAARLFQRVLDYTREIVREQGETNHHQRVRWWSALALLRAMASSPAAAAATLRSRSAAVDSDTADDADELGRRAVLDLEEDVVDQPDTTPGGDIDEVAKDAEGNKRRLLDMARQAEALKGDADPKLKALLPILKELIEAGSQPIVFCRFITTAEYLGDELRKRLPGVEVATVTGLVPHEEREGRVTGLAEKPRRVLVATDCLSEGINLQQYFDAVLHYDLSWNPTRHEQREGRVDRFGQPRSHVRLVTYYGIDNQIDGIVLDVLLRKHKTIRSALGISVPVPVGSDQVIEAVFEGLLLRERAGSLGNQLTLFDELLTPKTKTFEREWDNVTEREKRTRTMFAQESIKVDAVARELEAARAVVGSAVDVEAFVREALHVHGATVDGDVRVHVNLTEVPQALRDVLPVGTPNRFAARFTAPVGSDEVLLHRTNPVVEGLAAYVLDTALDPLAQGRARRSGVMRTTAVNRRTTVLLVRLRFDVHTGSQAGVPLLAEDVCLMAFEGAPNAAVWLEPERAEALLSAIPSGNVSPEDARHFVQGVVDGYAELRPHFRQEANSRAAELLDAHRRVRAASQERLTGVKVEPRLPVDVLGLYVFLPQGA
jgi:superfamily II DNA or RNA helicase